MKHPTNKRQRILIQKRKNRILFNRIRGYRYVVPIWYKNGVPKRYYFQSKYWKNQANRYIRRKRLSKIKQYKKEYPYIWKIW